MIGDRDAVGVDNGFQLGLEVEEFLFEFGPRRLLLVNEGDVIRFLVFCLFKQCRFLSFGYGKSLCLVRKVVRVVDQVVFTGLLFFP